METRHDAAARQRAKLRLVRGLYERGFAKEDVQQLFRLIDWLMILPEELQGSFRTEIYEYEMEQHMPYVTSIERMAKEEGMQEGRQEGREEGRAAERADLLEIISEGLTAKFADAGKKLATRVRRCPDIGRLKLIARALITAKSIKEVEKALREEA
jgi:predicted transposase YdaD